MKKTAIIAILVLLSACKDEAVKDVQYYLDNETERTEKVAACDLDPGSTAAEPNCINAREAQRKITLSGDGMPSIRLD